MQKIPQNKNESIFDCLEESEEMSRDIFQRLEENLTEWHEKLQKSLVLDEPVRQTYVYDEEKPMIQKKIRVSSKTLQMFEKYHQQILYYLRAKFVFEEIIQPIEKLELLDRNQQLNLEFLYLCSHRAFTYLKLAQLPFKNADVEEIVQQTQKYFVDSIFRMIPKVKANFDKYYKILTLKQNSIISRISSISSYFFDYKNKQKRDIYLCGFEGVDFTMEEQIQYTQEKYIKEVIVELLKNLSDVRRIAKLKNYLIILTIDIENLSSFDDFETIKQEIIQKSLEEKE